MGDSRSALPLRRRKTLAADRGPRMFVIAGMLMVKGKNPEKFTQKEKWRVHFAVLGYKSVFAVFCVSWVLWAAAADYLLYRM